MNILIFFIILLILVLVHEFGHFAVAKKFGIRVDEFGFGFPPKLFGYKKGETEYTFNLLPIGGFVKIFGENPDDENTNGPDKERSFVNKPRWQQALVLFAGVSANFFLAWLLFSFGFMSGLPASVGSEPQGYTLTDVNLTIISVIEESPAEVAGLKSGDKIISIQSGGEEVSSINPDTFKSFITSHGNKEIEIGYIRGLEEKINYIKVIPDGGVAGGEPKIGIAMDQIGIAKLPPLTAFWEGMKLTLYVTKGTALGLYTLVLDGLKGKGNLDAITGPVGMVGIVGDAYQFGFVYLLSFSALLPLLSHPNPQELRCAVFQAPPLLPHASFLILQIFAALPSKS